MTKYGVDVYGIKMDPHAAAAAKLGWMEAERHLFDSLVMAWCLFGKAKMI